MFPRPAGCRDFTLECRPQGPGGATDGWNQYTGLGGGPNLGQGHRVLYRRGCAQSGIIFQSNVPRADGKEGRADVISTKVSGDGSPLREQEHGNECNDNIADVGYAQLLAKCQLLQRQNDDKDRQLAICKEKIAALELHNATLKDHIKVSRNSDRDQSRLRNRFVSTFKRDVLKCSTTQDRTFISEGNECAHGGDAKVDARLYRGLNGRRDVYAFEKLYGLSPETVERIEDKETINVLNIHASVKASKYKTGNKNFYLAFNTYIDRLKASRDGRDGVSVGEGHPALNETYWAFIQASVTEVKEVGCQLLAK
ncbi:hypothetical protein HOY82DRAFT_641135 [Tuber indicum]|nr:hypothetical protein HOY82DRAFT_641135 [Tuber indicum]